MLLADATKATAESHWWEDWPKFLPGWLAFAWTLGIGARKVFLRRHHLALGPEADELRTQLTTTRALLEEVTSGKTGADWFMHEDRRETARGLRDAAERRDDPALKLSLTRVAGTWDEIFALAPPPRPRVRWVVANQDDVPSDQRPQPVAQPTLTEFRRCLTGRTRQCSMCNRPSAA